MKKKHSSAKQTSILAITIALYVVFFSISYSVTLPNFTLLYLPIILLGVFPVWFGWTGLAGSMIGAFVGGAFVERLGVLGVFESVVAFIIYFINWILLPSKPAEKGGKLRFFRLLGVLMVSLLAGTSYILWQYTVFPPLFNANEALASPVEDGFAQDEELGHVHWQLRGVEKTQKSPILTLLLW
jgi:hypothetical protein